MKYKLDNVATPGLESYGGVAPNLDYSERTMSEAVLDRAAEEKDFPALTFMGKATSYTRLAEEIDRVARAFYAIGVLQCCRKPISPWRHSSNSVATPRHMFHNPPREMLLPLALSQRVHPADACSSSSGGS